jgi:prepilin-type N-terminal cleavage/methylation domain-containing protein
VLHFVCEFRESIYSNSYSKNKNAGFNHWIPAEVYALQGARMTRRENSLSPITSTNHKAAGFTLVELAIVIVIIGLLVGGVLTGQSLIDNSKVSRVVTDVNKYSAAMQTFKMKYNAIPGDMRNAYTMFDGSGGSSVCGTNASTSNTGCNGNGDNLIGSINDLSEAGKAWVHLSLSNILPGLITYKSATGYSNLVSKPADLANAPPSVIMDYAVYDFSYAGRPSQGGGTYSYYGQSGLFMRVGFPSGQGLDMLDAYRNGATFTPELAAMLDRKIDDGLPGVGAVLAARAGGYGASYMGSCTTIWGNGFSSTSGNMTSADPSNTYLLSEKSTSCAMMFKVGAGFD